MIRLSLVKIRYNQNLGKGWLIYMYLRDSKRKRTKMLRLTTFLVVAFFLLAFGNVFSGATVVSAATPDDIEVSGEIKGDNKTHNITLKKGKMVYYSVIPDGTAYYTVKVLSDQDKSVDIMYMAIFDSNMKEIKGYSSNGYIYQLLEKGKTYYIGFEDKYQEEKSVVDHVKIYVDIKDYEYIGPSKIYVKDGKVTENDIDPSLYYVSGNKKYKANCKVTYQKFDPDTDYLESGDYHDGIPSECGKYRFYFTPVSPFIYSGYTSSKQIDLYIYDLNDFENYDISSAIPAGYGNNDGYYDTFYYTGKELDISKIEVKVNNEVLEMGKDYKYDGFCSSNAYSSMTSDGIKWKAGKPKAPGKYCLSFSGLGNRKGVQYKFITIEKAIDFDFVSVTDINSDSSKYKMDFGTMKVFKIQPEKTAEYNITLKNEIKGVTASLFDKNEGLILSTGEEGNNKKNLSFKVELNEGENYYLVVSNNSDAEKIEQYDVVISIPDYTVYVPAEKDEDKKIDDIKTEDNKVEEKTAKQDNTTQKNSEKKTDTQKSSNVTPLAKGKTFKSGGMIYKVTSTKNGSYQVGLIKNNNKSAKRVTVKDSVKYKSVTYKITSIGSSAFKNNKKLETVTLGKNISKIGKPAFKGCAKLKKIKVPKSRLSRYKKLLKKAGLSSGVKVSYK